MFDFEDVASEELADSITTGCRVVFKMAQPQAKTLGSLLWRRAKTEARNDIAKFRTLPHWEKAVAVTLFTVCASPVGWYAAMQDATPYLAQIWGGTVILGTLAFGLVHAFPRRLFQRY